MNSIGVDIGGSHITVCQYDLENSRLEESSLINRKIPGHGSKQEILNGWTDAITECEQSTSKTTSIKGLGIAMPGPFNYYNGISLISGLDKLNALFQVNIRLELAEKLKMQPSDIRFINDATAFSIAEAKIGSAKKFSRVVGITLGTGLGSSFLIDRKPILQNRIVPPGGFLYNQYYQNKLVDDIFSTRGILKKYENLSGKKVANVRILSEQAEIDSDSKKCLYDFGEELGVFLQPYLKQFEAEVLVIGGNISKAFPYFGHTLQNQLSGVEIHVSSMGEKAAIIGSAVLADEEYYNSIKSTLKLM